MRRSSTVVFDLICGMSAAERRFFQLFAQRHGGEDPKHYLLLFNMMVESGKEGASMQEAEWRKSLGKRGEDRHYRVLKHYLFDRLLEALSEYHAASDPIEQIKKGLHQARLLLQRGFPKAAASHLKKQQKKIEKFDAWEQLPESILLRRQLLDQRYYSGEDLSIDQIQQSIETALGHLQQHYKIWGLTASLALQHYRQSADSKAAFDQLCGWLGEIEKPKDLRNRFLWHRANAVTAFTKGDTQTAFQNNKALLDLLDGNTDWKKSRTALYLSVLTNYLIDCFRLKRDQEISQGIQEMRSLDRRPEFRKLKNLDNHIFRFSYMMELNQAVRSGQVKNIASLTPNIRKGLELHRDSIALHHRLTLQYLMAYVLFMNGQNRESLDWLELFFRLNDKEQILELQLAAAILEIMNHIEMDNSYLLEGLIRSVRKRFKISKKKRPALFQLFNHLTKWSEFMNKKAQEKKRVNFLSFLEQNISDSDLNKTCNYFNFTAWLRSKEKAIPIYQEIQREYR